jgi:uncharacterized protein
MGKFREVRRRDRAISEHEAREILARAEYGVLATVGDDGWPYAVPVNHVLATPAGAKEALAGAPVAGDVLYVHCALEGHKLENLANDARVSYCAVASTKIIPEKLSTLYESAIVFGRAALVTSAGEKNKALKLLTDRFCAGFPEQVEEALAKWSARTAIIRIQIERITGKAHRAET